MTLRDLPALGALNLGQRGHRASAGRALQHAFLLHRFLVCLLVVSDI